MRPVLGALKFPLLKIIHNQAPVKLADRLSTENTTLLVVARKSASPKKE
jgi:hypothetical protein